MTASRPAPSRAPRASAVAVRGAILRSALDAFAARGFDAVTTREIAAAAGIEQGHMAYYFTSKDALWRATVARFNAAFEALLDALPDGAGGDGADARALAPLLRFFAANRPLTRLMLQEFSLASGRHDWLVAQYGRPAWRRLRPWFQALAARRGAAVDPAQLYFAFLGGALLFFGSGEEVRQIAGEPADDDRFIAMHLALFGAIDPIGDGAEGRPGPRSAG